MSCPVMTDAAGIPIHHEELPLRAGKRGPVVMQDSYLFEKNQIFNRERVPERVVHAKGSGAYGTFRVTKDVTKYTSAKFLSEIGKTTKMIARFSTVAGESGFPDADRDVRGFALRFYTEDGNFDLVGNNTPVFFTRHPSRFIDFIHSQKRDPATGMRSWQARFDWWARTPESLHQVLILFSDRGIPKTYRHMHGYSSHTYSMVNADNERTWVKWHIRSMQGIENLTEEEAMEVKASDPDSHRRDLREAIDKKDFPKWKVCIQVMSEQEAEQFKYDPFDLTKVWPHSSHPLIEVGEMELNQNFKNYFAEIEQLAVSPSHMVPGLGVSPDPMLQARLFAYTDAASYRLGVNHYLLPVNRPTCPMRNLQYRDGLMRTGDNGQGHPNYVPNNDMDAEADKKRPFEPPLPLHGSMDRYQVGHPDDVYEQPGNLFRLLSKEEKQRTYQNFAGKLAGCGVETIDLMLKQFQAADKELASGVRNALEQT